MFLLVHFDPHAQFFPMTVEKVHLQKTRCPSIKRSKVRANRLTQYCVELNIAQKSLVCYGHTHFRLNEVTLMLNRKTSFV